MKPSGLRLCQPVQVSDLVGIFQLGFQPRHLLHLQQVHNHFPSSHTDFNHSFSVNSEMASEKFSLKSVVAYSKCCVLEVKYI